MKLVTLAKPLAEGFFPWGFSLSTIGKGFFEPVRYATGRMINILR